MGCGKDWSRGKTCVDDVRITHKYTYDDVFCKNSKATASRARMLLLRMSLKEYKCSVCGVTDWNGLPLKLQMHHINGDRYDHNLENLEFVCPNCHSQTPNFCNSGNAKSRNYMITDEEILLALTKNNIMRDVIEMLGYSDKNPNIRKRIKRIAKDNNITVIRYRNIKTSVGRFCECGKRLTAKQLTQSKRC